MTHTESFAADPRQSAARDVRDDVDLDRFLAGLTALSLECGIGITDAPTLYVLEREDRDYSYAADKDGHLVLR